MTAEIHCNTAERRCAMAAQSQMGVLPGKRFFVYVANLSAKPVNLPEFMKASILLDAPECTVHPCDHDKPNLNTKQESKTHCDKTEDKSPISSVHQIGPERAVNICFDTEQ